MKMSETERKSPLVETTDLDMHGCFTDEDLRKPTKIVRHFNPTEENFRKQANTREGRVALGGSAA